MPFLNLNTDVKDWLGIDAGNTQYDTLLTIIRDSVEQSVLNYIEVALAVTGPVMEIYDASEADQLVLQNFPIVSVAAVYFGVKPNGTGGELIDAGEYYVDKDTGAITFQSIYTPKGRSLIRVDYSYGYNGLPADIKHAMLMGIEADYRRKTSKSIGSDGRSKKDERETFKSGSGAWDPKTGLPTEVVFKLQTYKRYEMIVQPIAQRNL